ncbi:MAG: hypothetical protein PF481_11105 [Bacteroidales bacterium]|jgi:hypothetical protein|nr:hypothetical protein [Bacteroidales bacterium]
MDKDKKVIAQSKSQIAEAYNISLKTFNCWIEPIKEDIGKYRGKSYTPKQVKMIYDLLGRP